MIMSGALFIHNLNGCALLLGAINSLSPGIELLQDVHKFNEFVQDLVTGVLVLLNRLELLF